jgi:hypothetical protein
LHDVAIQRFAQIRVRHEHAGARHSSVGILEVPNR